LQAWQAAQLLDPQQTPSTQAPLMHWVPAVQARPLALSAQLLLVVPWQVNGDTQSVSAVHVVLHALVPHTKGEQGMVAGVAHAPAPVQWEMGVNVEPVQEASPQLTLALASAQAPAPLHRPVFPQGGLAVQRASDMPAAMLAQVPGLPVLLHCWQSPQVEVAQQTPSTQKLPVRQSVVALHGCPSRFLVPQRFVFGSQMLGARQSVSTVQADLHALVPLHRNGAHGMPAAAALQVPAPSQVRAGVSEEARLGHDGATHCVPAA
jgi:hypothetical protein